MGVVRETVHLARRFAASLVPRGPNPADERWLLGLLSPPEAVLYRAQSDLDRRHSVTCARAAREQLGGRASTPVVVASALHDVGKTDARLGTFGRVLATLVAKTTTRATMHRWADDDGLRGRIGRYAEHDRRGAALLAEAGSHPMVVAWAAEHHGPIEDSTLETEIAEALQRADR